MMGKLILRLRSSHLEVFCKKGHKIPRRLRRATLLKKRLWHWCFPVNFAKFLRTPFLTEHLRWLLLHVRNSSFHTLKWYVNFAATLLLLCCQPFSIKFKIVGFWAATLPKAKGRFFWNFLVDLRAICKSQNEESANGMRGMMVTLGIRVGIRGIGVGMWEIRLGMQGSRVGMWGIRVILCENLRVFTSAKIPEREGSILPSSF